MRRCAVIILVPALTVGCSDAGDNITAPTEGSIPVTIESEGFLKGDIMGVYTVPGGESPGDIAFPANVPFIYDGSSWTPVDDEHLYVEQPLQDIYAYFPYDPQLGAVPGKLDMRSYPVDLSGVQRQRESDLLWARASVDTRIDNWAPLSFGHLFAMLTITVQSPPDYSASFVELHNVSTSAIADLVGGTVLTRDNTGIVILYPTAPDTFHAVLPPQTIDSLTPLMLIRYRDYDTYYTTENELQIRAGGNYHFEIIDAGIDITSVILKNTTRCSRR